MKGFPGEKKQDVQPPFTGCLGKMIKMLDLSTGMAATKMLTEKPHRDVSPAGRQRSTNAFKMAIDPIPAQIEDKQTENQLRRDSPTKRSGGTPVKALMEREMWKEGAPDCEPPNVIARLMGLNGSPVQQSHLISGKQLGRDYHPDGLGGHYRNRRHQKEGNCLQDRKRGAPQLGTCTMCEDTWNGYHHQPSRNDSSKCIHQDKESSYEKRMSLVRQKFTEAKRLATDEKLLHSKEFQETLQFLSSNKDLFVKFLEEPNPLLSKDQHVLQPVTPPSEIKQITILKPSESIRTKSNVLLGKKLFSDGEESEGNRNMHFGSLSASPTNSCLSEPTRIVVLKPGLGKTHDRRIMRSPASSMAAAVSEDDSVLWVDETLRSRSLARDITWQMRNRLKNKQAEENLLSSGYSDSLVGEDSFCKSEIENTKEVAGEISDDLEFGTPTSGRSWDFMSRIGSPYSASCSSQTSHVRESSVVREAKKRILERWTMVSSTANSHEESEARRSTSTLGEMLTIPKVKKAEEFGGITLESGDSQLDSEGPFLCLPRSRSVPVSSAYGGIELNGGASCPLSNTSAGSREVDKERSRKSSSFRGKVSSLFFSKNKKPAKEKSDPSVPPPAVNDRLQHGSAVTLANVSDDSSCFALDSQQKESTLINQTDDNTARRCPANSCHTHNVTNIPAKDSSYMSSLGASGIFGEPQDQPSPVSVLDGPFRCDNTSSLRQSSEHFITERPQALSRSPLIGSFSRSLSWEDSQFEVMSPNSLRLSRLFSRADEDEDSLTFIQKLVCSAGPGEDLNTRWHSLASHLNPQLLEQSLDYRQEGLKSRERRVKERLLFDSVNEALIDIGWTSILAAYPWACSRSSERKDCQDDFGNSAADEIWQVIRNWSMLDRCSPVEPNDRNLVVDVILKRELTEMTAANVTRFEMFELNADVCSMVLEELVEDVLVDLTNF